MVFRKDLRRRLIAGMSFDLDNYGLLDSALPEAVSNRRLEHVASHPLEFESDEEVYDKHAATSELPRTRCRTLVSQAVPQAVSCICIRNATSD